jgi:hypothetical protein
MFIAQYFNDSTLTSIKYTAFCEWVKLSIYAAKCGVLISKVPWFNSNVLIRNRISN